MNGDALSRKAGVKSLNAKSFCLAVDSFCSVIDAFCLAIAAFGLNGDALRVKRQAKEMERDALRSITGVLSIIVVTFGFTQQPSGFSAQHAEDSRDAQIPSGVAGFKHAGLFRCEVAFVRKPEGAYAREQRETDGSEEDLLEGGGEFDRFHGECVLF
ncbi:MAG: hypothetical protein KME07_18320 [Pegethrix bostrychoides GSE-TBD4-15B]|jgi:hypothetical protein|uniref:Uncharacterized protein n=1 Tax=Pegethrix bostrychoides GSE-TBD4-15B TaxID=2839662 RepID=A0A951U687_9CYAN|nr:hypothetical protein [Pegethrix bostrychoides GSE-TBD4-15B]